MVIQCLFQLIPYYIEKDPLYREKLYTISILVHHARKPISDNSLMALLKHIRTSITAILLITILTITVTTSIQPVFAPRSCAGCGDFLKLTAEFENTIINLIIETEGSGEPPVRDFLKSTGQFKRDIINSVLAGHDIAGDPTIPNLVEKYGFSVVVDPEDPIITPVILNYQNHLLNLFSLGTR